MPFGDKLLYRAFGLPTGVLGRLGGKIMAGRRQLRIAEHVADHLDVCPGDKVLEIRFGPGVAIQHMHERLGDHGLIVGIDPSEVMLQMASTRNAEAIDRGSVRLVSGTVTQIPFEDEFFDKGYAMNSFQLWPDKLAGLREIRRVLKPGGPLVLSFYGPAQRGITREFVREQLKEAGFKEITVTSDSDSVLYFVARK